MTDIESTPGEPAHPASMASSVGQGDLPLDGESGVQMVVATAPSRGRKKWMLPAAIFLVVAMLAAIIGLAVGLTRSNNANSSDVNSNIGDAANDGNDESPISAPPVAAPTMPPIPAPPTTAPPTAAPPTAAPIISPAVVASKLERVQNFILEQEYSAAASFDDVDSPQSRAAKFMAEGDLEVPTASFPAFNTYKWMEEYALAVFYYAMGGPSWISQSKFLHPTNPTCGWFLPIQIPGFANNRPEGVLCTTSSGIVDTIQFFNNNLQGSLPAELGLLTGLKRFYSVQDNISGSIPDTFRNLKSLVAFQCDQCNISGSIPDWFGELTALQSLFLKDSQVTGSFPTSMSSLTNLVLLSVENNFLSGDFSALEGMRRLAYIYAEDNAFVQTIGSTFLQNLPLERLDISDNGFIGQVPVHLMETLTTMDVHGNSLTSFPDTIPETGKLDFLAIFGNPITGPFPNTITNLVTSLDHLDATSTQFTGTMPTILGNMTKLGYLFLADTTFTPGPIPHELQSLTNLVDLSLKDSGRTGVLPTWLGDLDKIVLLDLDSNEFTGAIPTEIANMANLRALLLNRNDLTGSIPTEFGFLTDLRIAHFDHNPALSGSLEPWCSSVTSIITAVADCDNTTALAPLVECPCCTLCCASDNTEEQCNQKDSLASIDPEWSNGYSRGINDQYLFRDGNITKDQGDRNLMERMATPYGGMGDKVPVQKNRVDLFF